MVFFLQLIFLLHLYLSFELLFELLFQNPLPLLLLSLLLTELLGVELEHSSPLVSHSNLRDPVLIELDHRFGFF